MAFERLLPNVDDGGWVTGTFDDINQGVNQPTDGNVMATVVKGDAVVLGFTASAVVDADVVTQVGFRVRARTTGSGTDTLGIAYLGTEVATDQLTSTFTDYFLTSGSWNVDRTAAQMDATQIIMWARQQGMPTAVGHEIAELEMLVTYDPATPVFGQIVQKDFGIATTGTTVIAAWPSTPSSGNLLIAAVAEEFSGQEVSARPSGYTALTGITGAGKAFVCDWCYKISDGTEVNAQYTFASTIVGAKLWLIEIEWDGSTPTVQTNEDETNKNTSVVTQSSSALTPSSGGASNNVVVGAIGNDWQANHGNSHCDNDNFTDETWVDQAQATAQMRPGYVRAGAPASSQSFNVYHNDTVDEMYGALAVFNIGGAGGAIQGSTSLAVTGTGAIDGRGELAGAETVALAGAGVINGIGTLAGAETLTFAPVSVLSSKNAIQGSETILFADAAALTATGQLQGAETIAFADVAALSALADGIGTALLTFGDAALLNGIGSLAGAQALVFTPTGAIAGKSMIQGAETITFADAAILTGSGQLQAAETISLTAVSNLIATGQLQGSETLIFTGAGDLNVAGAVGAIQGTVTMTFADAAALQATGALAGVETLSFTAAANLFANGQLQGAETIAFTGSSVAQAFGALLGAESINLAAVANLVATGAVAQQ
jgi:hypothetical protein